MKHFLPSSVILTPFVVKHYDEEPNKNENPETEHKNSSNQCKTSLASSKADESN